MSASSILDQLISRFENNLDAYKSPKYNETQLRLEFINPMFELLGWDVSNKEGYAEAYKDVIHEDAIKIGGATKAPDYSFRIGGARKFFLETKRPAVNIKDDSEPAFQLRRYAWSAKLPLSILTDFEEFAVYDCRIKPARNDKPSTGRIMYFNYNQYPEKWEDLSSIFSREEILKGSFDRFVESEKKKRGTAEVDDAFLKEIESWRDALARNIALRNAGIATRGLTEREINYAVQLTIDRIIFLRICEDRGIEDYGRLQALLNGEHIYKRMLDLYYRADEKYNSGLFHFQLERGRPGEPDELTPELKIDDKVLKDIIKGLYYPESPYEFSVLPVDILGHVYERFLGKVIRLTAGGRAKVEEKPEVRKAGGVYYTPKYIVEYIVKNTVGKRVEKKKPKQVESIRILDPACGSGSFLIGAYEYLLDWHRDWYLENGPEKHKNEIYQGAGGQWYLTTSQKKKILLNNIYGVDIDAQAVEVTKLNLLLKALEGENEQTIESQLKMFRERALPDLRGNIKCGNSLIGPDFYDNMQLNLLDDEERYRINAFDWEVEFEKIMKSGGFDAVIGNPPYVRSINLKEFNQSAWSYYQKKYISASEKEWDIYLVFVEKGISLINPKGYLGYILPNKFLNSMVGKNLRGIISNNKNLLSLIHFGAFQVFNNATTYTCLLFLKGHPVKEASISRYKGSINSVKYRCSLPDENNLDWVSSKINNAELSAEPWDFSISDVNILKGLKKWPQLGKYYKIYQGTGTRADKVFVLNKIQDKNKNILVYSSQTQSEHILESSLLKNVLRGRSIKRYKITENDLVLIVPYKILKDKYELISCDELSEKSSQIYRYLEKCKPRLEVREKGRFKGTGWYCFGRPQNMMNFEIPEKIVFPDVGFRGEFYLDRERRWLIDTAYALVPLDNNNIDLRYVLGILNSSLLTYFLKETGTSLRGGYFRMKTAYLNPFPFRLIDFTVSTDKSRHEYMVSLVEEMLELHKQ